MASTAWKLVVSSGKDIEEIVFVSDEEPAALIPDGIYNVVFHHYEKAKFFNNKIYVWFKVCDSGPHLGVKIFRAYNYYSPIKRGSALFKDLALLHGGPVQKRTPLPLKLFKNKVLKVKVRTVTHDHKQMPIPTALQYSVVDLLIGAETSA